MAKVRYFTLKRDGAGLEVCGYGLWMGGGEWRRVAAGNRGLSLKPGPVCVNTPINPVFSFSPHTSTTINKYICKFDCLRRSMHTVNTGRSSRLRRKRTLSHSTRIRRILIYRFQSNLTYNSIGSCRKSRDGGTYT